MKSFPSNILDKIEKKSQNFYPILFYGNESGLISRLIKSLYNILQKKLEIYDIKYFDYKNDKDEELKYVLNNSSLFSKTNFIVLINPQDQLIIELENIKKIENILIVNGDNLNTKSKIKSYFDNHQNFISVPCYHLDRNYIKKTIDASLKSYNIKLKNEAYWFLIENISEDFLTLENELQKLSIFKNSSVDLEDLQKLIVKKHNFNAYNYFFNSACGNSDLILQEMNSSNKSINESYEILLSLKKFIHILSNAVVNKNEYSLDHLVKIYLPKYLFLKKEIFREILRKTNLSKVNKINKMLQKTEYLLRKNSELHKEILERFLLNLARIMK